MYRLAYNPTATPVIVDAAGRTLAAGAHGPVDDVSPFVDREEGRGRLVYVDLADGQDVSADVAGAVDRIEALNARRGRLLDGLTPTRLRTLAGDRGLPADVTPAQLAGILAADDDLDVDDALERLNAADEPATADAD